MDGILCINGESDREKGLSPETGLKKKKKKKVSETTPYAQKTLHKRVSLSKPQH